MADLGIPYIGQTDPLSRVSSYVDCQTQEVLYPDSLIMTTEQPCPLANSMRTIT